MQQITAILVPVSILGIALIGFLLMGLLLNHRLSKRGAAATKKPTEREPESPAKSEQSALIDRIASLEETVIDQQAEIAKVEPLRHQVTSLHERQISISASARKADGNARYAMQTVNKLGNALAEKLNDPTISAELIEPIEIDEPKEPTSSRRRKLRPS